MKHMSRIGRVRPTAKLSMTMYGFKQWGGGWVRKKDDESFAYGIGCGYNVNDVIHVDGKITTVGYNGEDTDIWNSTDGGSTWIKVPSVGVMDLRSIAYGLGCYVAISQGGNILYSTDAVDWIYAANPFGAALSGRVTSVCFGNNRFIAIGLDDKSMVSYDGLNWQVLTQYQALGRISYVNGRWFGSGIPGGYKFFSSDGNYWVSNGKWGTGVTTTDVVYHNGYYFMVATNGWVYRGTDGISWGTVGGKLNGGALISKLVSKNGRLLYGNSAGYLSYSDDNGLTWVQQYFGAGQIMSAVLIV